MSELVNARPMPVARLRDLVDLGKPRLSLMVIFTSAIGVWLAPTRPGLWITATFVVATSCLVAAANALNCWIERELDGLMQRTRNRPLPAGRLEPRTALASGLVLATLALGTLAVSTNDLTLLLGAIALVSYVAIYTPLKRLTPWAVLVGAVPGALPPLMGWTAATGRLAAPGWFLFGILFLWQLPHFLAISLYLKEDFRRAGFRVFPLTRGDRATRIHLLVFSVALTLWTLLALPIGVAGRWFTATAALLGAVQLALAAGGVRRRVEESWARRLFGWTLIYLPVLVAVLVLDSR